MQVIVNVDEAHLALADGHASVSLQVVTFESYLIMVVILSREWHEAERWRVYGGEVTQQDAGEVVDPAEETAVESERIVS